MSDLSQKMLQKIKSIRTLVFIKMSEQAQKKEGVGTQIPQTDKFKVFLLNLSHTTTPPLKLVF